MERDTPNWSENTVEDETWYVRPGRAPESVPSELNCDSENRSRWEPSFDRGDLRWGNGTQGTWELRVEKRRYQRGEKVRIRLRNVSDKELKRNNSSWFNLQVYTEAGWEIVNMSSSGEHSFTTKPLPDNLVLHKAGEDHFWEFLLNESGIPGYTCPKPQPGRYRFVFFGLDEQDDALAVSFDLAE